MPFYYFVIDLVRTLDSGVWLEVGDCCGSALPPVRMRNWYIYPGIALLCHVTYPSVLYYEFVLYHTYGVPSDDAHYGGDYSTI